jgi:nucleoside-diphosphate-sugar epimerase
MKILITGSTGFIGKYVINNIIDANYENITIVACTSNINSFIDTFPPEKYNLIVKPYDIYGNQNEINLYDYFERPTKLIHLAWKGLPNYDKDFHITENLAKDFYFITNLIRNGLKDITVTGTCFEYGNIEGEMFENFTTNPSSYYALAKDTLRNMLLLFQKQYDFDLKWLRLFYMYGLGQNPNSIISQLDKALNNGDKLFNMSGGEQIRDYLKVEEVANYIVRIATLNNIDDTINISSGLPVKLSDFISNYIKSKNRSIELNKGYYKYLCHEPMRFWGNNQKLLSLLK